MLFKNFLQEKTKITKNHLLIFFCKKDLVLKCKQFNSNEACDCFISITSQCFFCFIIYEMNEVCLKEIIVADNMLAVIKEKWGDDYLTTLAFYPKNVNDKIVSPRAVIEFLIAENDASSDHSEE